MRIYLLGFMSAGKSTLGPVLAGRGGLEFVDLDTEIAAAAGREIAAIFEAEGEAGFRDRERAALELASRRDGLVVATGGGVVERAENHPRLLAGHAVYLCWPWEQLWRRLSRQRQGRPLLSLGREELEARWRLRDPIYRRLAAQELRMSAAGRGSARAVHLAALADEILAAAGGR